MPIVPRFRYLFLDTCMLVRARLLILSSFILFAIERTFFFFLNWSLVDLQCCVCFKCTAEWFSYTYIYIYISILFQGLFSAFFFPSTVEETHIIAPPGATTNSCLQFQQVFNMAQHIYTSCYYSKTEFLLLSPEFIKFLQSLVLPRGRGKN